MEVACLTHCNMKNWLERTYFDGLGSFPVEFLEGFDGHVRGCSLVGIFRLL